MSMFLAAMLLSQPQVSLPTIPREFRAAWVATVDNIDWPSKRDLTTDQQQRELLAIFEKASEVKLNAIVFQIRPSADALYASKLEPWSEYLTGRQGRAPSPEWDPLTFAVDQAHKRGMELHVWFNPYRANHPAQKGPVADTHLAKTNPSIVKKYGNYLWMDPSEPEVQKRSLDVMLDVVKRYDIDGVHIDDYFYPYPITDEAKNKIDFPDQASWQKYQSSGGRLSRGDWRRKSVDDFIEKLYKGIKRSKQHVKFGISPFGIYRPGIPSGIKAGVDQFDELYADAEKWLKEGWCDYYSPQLYWPIKQTPQAYPTLLKYWLNVNPKNRHVWPGLYTGRTDPKGGNWMPEEVNGQIQLSREQQPTAGNVHFSFKCLAQNFNGITSSLKSGLYKEHAFIPATPWLGDDKAQKPRMKKERGMVRFWPDCEGELMAISYQENGIWSRWQPYQPESLLEANRKMAVVSLSRTGVASDPTFNTP
jgi:uncharacterized lipoprotein YddW (UPF0748 family)